MKRLVTVAVVIGLLAGAMGAPAEAGKKKKKPAPVKVDRVVEFEYKCPCGVKIGPANNAGPGFQLGSATGDNIGGGPVTFNPSTEKYLTAKAVDSSGQPIWVNIAMDLDPATPTVNDTVGSFCGETKEPIELADTESEFRVFINSGLCDDATPALALGGTITFTLSNMP